MKKAIIYRWNKMNEIKVHMVNDKAEYSRVMNLLYECERDKVYFLIGELNLENEHCYIEVISFFNTVLEKYFPQCPVCLCGKLNPVTNHFAVATNHFECTIEMKYNLFVDSYIINLTNEFYNMLEMFFKDCGFKIKDYNNTRNIFWFEKEVE